MSTKGLHFQEEAFSRLELLITLAIVASLGVFTVSALANTKARSQRLVCLGNLQQIGHAYQVWGNDRGNKVPCRTPLSEGGTFQSPNALKNNAWFHLAVMSNELVTPRILVCPSDQNVGNSRVTANNWSGSDLSGGYGTVGYRDRATSYTVFLDAYFDQPRAMLSGDRNLKPSGLNAACSSGVGAAQYFYLALFFPGGYSGAWTNSIHQQSGNVLLYDGTVEETSSSRFLNLLLAPYLDNDNGSLHFIAPN